MQNCLEIINQIVNYFCESTIAGLILKNKIKAEVGTGVYLEKIKFYQKSEYSYGIVRILTTERYGGLALKPLFLRLYESFIAHIENTTNLV